MDVDNSMDNNCGGAGGIRRVNGDEKTFRNKKTG